MKSFFFLCVRESPLKAEAPAWYQIASEEWGPAFLTCHPGSGRPRPPETLGQSAGSCLGHSAWPCLVPAGASLPSSALSARAHGPCRPHASAQGPTGQRAGLPSCLRGCHCRVSGLSWLTVPLAGPPGRTPGNSHCGPRQPSQNCTSQKRGESAICRSPGIPPRPLFP